MELNRSRTAKYIGGAKARNIKNGGIRATPATKTHLLEGQGARLVQGLSPIHPGIHHLEGFDLKQAFASHTPSLPLANRLLLQTDRLFDPDTLTIDRSASTDPPSSTCRHPRQTDILDEPVRIVLFVRSEESSQALLLLH